MDAEQINALIKEHGVDTNLISDGYHTFGELYDHRIHLWIKLMEDTMIKVGHFEGHECSFAWRTQKHSDGSVWDGWFLLGFRYKPGEQITYHLPMSLWEECYNIPVVDQAPEWDGHTSADALERIKNL